MPFRTNIYGLLGAVLIVAGCASDDRPAVGEDSQKASPEAAPSFRCNGEEAIDCDDGDACTRDKCSSKTGCSHQPIKPSDPRHDICEVSNKPEKPCNTDACVTAICAEDPFCCEEAWDGQCVSEVTSICGQSCGGA